ncbi:MAG: serine/threonine protein kinase [Proteobacteria bacterium]|nr:serine/threonine protein kinase [Pseudomonadota bacterium]
MITPEPGTTVGVYELTKRLGEGAAAEVWLATMIGVGGFKKKVAIKLLKGSLSEERTEALINEARLTALLAHLNIVDVLTVETAGDGFFLAMEYVPGGTLRELTSRVKEANVGFPQSVIVDLCIGIARGLGAAHEQSILHRDLKPENVLLDHGTARIIDFGLARASEEASGEASGVRGTARYVPPGVWRKQADIGPPSDLFALGCMLFEMVTLKQLFQGTPAEIIAQMKGRGADRRSPRRAGWAGRRGRRGRLRDAAGPPARAHARLRQREPAAGAGGLDRPPLEGAGGFSSAPQVGRSLGRPARRRRPGPLGGQLRGDRRGPRDRAAVGPGDGAGGPAGRLISSRWCR